MSQLIIPGQPPGVQPNQVKISSPLIDVDQMREHLSALHAGCGTNTEIALCYTAPDQRFSHMWGPWAAFAEGLRVDADFWRDWIANGRSPWDMYTTVCTFAKHKQLSWRKHENARQVPGVWADLDVRPSLAGHFSSEAELHELLTRLPQPTMLVRSGSGGLHAYWLLPPRQRLKAQTPEAADLLEGWHALLQREAGDRQVDNVQELSRVLRVAGTVRWAKESEHAGFLSSEFGRRWTRVELVSSGGPRYEQHELLGLVAEPLALAREQRRIAEERWKVERRTALAGLERRGLGMSVQAHLERLFNETEDWANLLERAGWKLAADNRERNGSSACRYWIRPGNGERSHGAASTDFGTSTVLTFFSPEVDRHHELVIPGLSHGNNHGATTKYRFALITLYDGDEGRLIRDIHNGRGRLA